MGTFAPNADRSGRRKKGMDQKEALSITRKKLTAAERNLLSARKRNAKREDIEGLERKIAYYTYIEDVLLVLERWAK